MVWFLREVWYNASMEWGEYYNRDAKMHLKYLGMAKEVFGRSATRDQVYYWYVNLFISLSKNSDNAFTAYKKQLEQLEAGGADIAEINNLIDEWHNYYILIKISAAAINVVRRSAIDKSVDAASERISDDTRQFYQDSPLTILIF